MSAPLLLRHPASLQHDTGTHPERAARQVALERELGSRDWLGWEVRESVAVPRDVVEAVHTPRYVSFVEATCAGGGGVLDMGDTVVSPGSWAAALHAVGGAVAVVDALLDGAAPVAASAHRPPGHHALADRGMGFCIFNHVAVAAQHALDAHGLQRVLIIDWDVHHGNGTNDLFHDTDRVLFASVHQSPFYPGTGPAADTGAGAGAGHTVNLPVPAGSGDETWLSLVDHVIRPLGRAYRPQLVLVSAGYDAHGDDPLGSCRVSDAGFAGLAASARALAEETGAPLGLVLEGGYDVHALARSFAATLEVTGAARAPAPPDVPLHPLARAARDRLAERWPAVAAD